ncbi:MAG: hypothetical protein HKN26_11625 [Acidimicrobiales bacterium]|nr:hypothetical protein [Acidimicrobiales bacterium]
MNELHVGGVPEHFNLPWFHVVENPARRLGPANQEPRGDGDTTVVWHEQRGGTGQMMQQLGDGTLDVAIALTEGIVTAIAKGLPARIVRFYTTTPLQWGVHVAAGSSIGEEADIGPDHRYAVSRLGSGSHLMAHVLADRLGHTVADDRFVIVGDIDGARQALADGDADLFLWDRFMTSLYVDNGEFRRVGVQPTPWPAFAVAARTDVLADRRAEVDDVLDAVAAAGQSFAARPADAAVAEVVERFGLADHQARDWFASTAWDDGNPADPALIDPVQQRLVALGLIDAPVPLDRLLADSAPMSD